jgi:hypothetical protein
VRVAVTHDPAEAIPLQGTWTGVASDHLAMQVAVKVTDGPMITRRQMEAQNFLDGLLLANIWQGSAGRGRRGF